MLQIKNLTINLMEDNRTIIEDFNLTLNQGDKLGLIGEEGNGKSLLLKTILDRKKIEDFCEVKGEIFKENDIIAYLPQSIDDENLELSTQEYMSKYQLNEYIDYNQLYKYLNLFNLDDDILTNDIKIKNLSGGEKIKFVLLVEMMKNPTIFIFDEPSNDLDFESLKFLEKFMLEMDIPLIFVSHDTNLLKKVANRIIHLEQILRRTKSKYSIYNGSYDEYINQREQFIINETNRSQKEHEEFSKKVDRYKRVHDSVQSALRGTKNDVQGKNLKDKMHTVKSIGKRLEKEEANLTKEPDYEEAINIFFDSNIVVPNGKVILDFKLDELKVCDKLLAKNINLKITGPEHICIIGKNGIGKTTLIRKIYDELMSLNVKVGYMPQSYFEFEKKNISAIDYLSKEYTKEEHTKISLFLGSLNFKREEMYRNINKLSGGQKAKLFFAKMNLEKAQVLILDEPTRNLSPLSQPEIIEALKEYKGAIIAVSHDREFIEKVFDTIYELNENGLYKKN